MTPRQPSPARCDQRVLTPEAPGATCSMGTSQASHAASEQDFSACDVRCELRCDAHPPGWPHDPRPRRPGHGCDPRTQPPEGRLGRHAVAARRSSIRRIVLGAAGPATPDDAGGRRGRRVISGQDRRRGRRSDPDQVHLPKPLTPEEVSDHLRIPVDTLYAWRYRGVGPPALRIGRHPALFGGRTGRVAGRPGRGVIAP